jgi:hypothetical protein
LYLGPESDGGRQGGAHLFLGGGGRGGGGGPCPWSGEPWPGSTPSAYLTPLVFLSSVP